MSREHRQVLRRESQIPLDYRDPLTGLFNLDGFFDAMERNAGRFVHSAIIHFDVDDFKSFNEQYGFMGGNQFLQSVAEELRITFIDSVLARAGGDHFVVATTAENAEDRIVDFQERMKAHMRNMQISVKAGVYYPAPYEKGNTALFLDRAKLACDQIKHTYDRSYRVYTPGMEKSRLFRHSIITNFDKALSEGQIIPYYQPHVRLLTGERCGYEALSRWIDKDNGMISPAVFIEILEDAHLIHLLDLHIIDQVCQDLRYIIDHGLNALPVSVNLSRLDFYLCNVFHEIEAIRKKYDIPARFLHIEVTESALTEEGDFLLSEIPRFHKAGYEVWMDDFGSGYSSLNNLMSYPFDMLKIDMNFLREFETNPKSHIILAAIVRMAKKLGIHTLAEGVETQEQYDFLREIGCEKIQGYFKGRPAPFDREKANEDALNQSTDLVTHDGHPVEPNELTAYYDQIGRINVLSGTPLSPKSLLDATTQPLAVLEHTEDDSKIYALYTNDSYRRYIEHLGYEMDWSQPLMPFTLDELMKNPVYGKLVRRCIASHEEEVEPALMGDIAAQVHVKILAEHGKRKAYAVTIENLIDPKDFIHTFDVLQRSGQSKTEQTAGE